MDNWDDYDDIIITYLWLRYRNKTLQGTELRGFTAAFVYPSPLPPPYLKYM